MSGVGKTWFTRQPSLDGAECWWRRYGKVGRGKSLFAFFLFFFFICAAVPPQGQACAFKHEFKRCQPLCLARQLFPSAHAQRAWRYEWAPFSVHLAASNGCKDSFQNSLLARTTASLVQLLLQQVPGISTENAGLVAIPLRGGNGGLPSVEPLKHLAQI